VTRALDPKLDGCFFQERDPIAAVDLARIQPLELGAARSVWEKYVSADRRQRHPMLLGTGHWLAWNGTRGPDWQASWSIPARDHDDVVAFMTAHVPWPDETPTLFFWMRERVVLVPWAVFRRTWRNFLYDDEGSFLLSPEAADVVWFGPTGTMGICQRE